MTTATGKANLQEGGIYYIQSISNSELLNVDGGKFVDGTAIINWGLGGNASTRNEQWKVTNSPDGESVQFEINSETPGKVLDENTSKHQLNLWFAYNGPKQHWILEPVAYTIKNVATGKDLRSNGHGNTLTTVTPNKTDFNTFWFFNQHDGIQVEDEKTPNVTATTTTTTTGPPPNVTTTQVDNIGNTIEKVVVIQDQTNTTGTGEQNPPPTNVSNNQDSTNVTYIQDPPTVIYIQDPPTVTYEQGPTTVTYIQDPPNDGIVEQAQTAEDQVIPA